MDIDLRGAYRAYASPASKRRYQYAVLGTFLLGINFLYSEYNGLIAIRDQYEESLPGRAEALAGDRWYEGGRTDPAAEEEAGKEYDHVLDIKLGTWYF